jgi:hypothetical protein
MADPVAPFAPALSELALDIFERVGLQAGALTTTHMTSLRRSMNLTLVRWANRGINLWRVQPVTIPLLANTPTYTLNPALIDMLDAYRRVTVGGINTDIIMSPMSRATYAALPNKAVAAPPIQFLFERQVTPTVTIWPVPATADYSMVFYAFTQIADADPAGGNTANLPYRALEAFTAGVAAHMAVKWAPERKAMLAADANETFGEFSDNDTETVVLTMAPDLSAYFS